MCFAATCRQCVDKKFKSVNGQCQDPAAKDLKTAVWAGTSGQTGHLELDAGCQSKPTPATRPPTLAHTHTPAHTSLTSTWPGAWCVLALIHSACGHIRDRAA